jgi:hypothetical protein
LNCRIYLKRGADVPAVTENNPYGWNVKQVGGVQDAPSPFQEPIQHQQITPQSEEKVVALHNGSPNEVDPYFFTIG